MIHDSTFLRTARSIIELIRLASQNTSTSAAMGAPPLLERVRSTDKIYVGNLTTATVNSGQRQLRNNFVR